MTTYYQAYRLIINVFQILLYLTSFYFGMFMILEIGLLVFKVKHMFIKMLDI